MEQHLILSRRQTGPAGEPDRVRELTGAGTQVVAMVEPLLAILSIMLKEFGGLTKQVLDVGRKEQVCRRLMNTPGT